VLLQFARGRPGPLLSPEPPIATPVEVYAGDPFISRLHGALFLLVTVCCFGFYFIFFGL